MDTENLFSRFAQIGARMKVVRQPARRVVVVPGALVLDIRKDRKGEYFEVLQSEHTDPEVAVLDVQPAERHLLLLVRQGSEKQKYLCGHDERHWFVAAIPEAAPVGTVRQAKEALKPAEVRIAQDLRKLREVARNRRKNAAYRRQGEWFFLPVPNMVVDKSLVLRDEPIQRGNGKPHRVEFCYRTGGETVYVCPRYPGGILVDEYQRIITDTPRARGWSWRVMRRNAGVYAKGKVRHADHKTIVLRCWHHVLMNTENQARAMRNMAFLD